MDFEVKTRASTVLSVISTAEEIFAIAKELLRTEIDADFPHPLRLRLMGMTSLYIFSFNLLNFPKESTWEIFSPPFYFLSLFGSCTSAAAIFVNS